MTNTVLNYCSDEETYGKIIPLHTQVSFNEPVVPASTKEKTYYGFKNSPLTASGKPKAQPSSPVKSIEEINKINNYFYTNGTTEWIRKRNWMMWNLGITLGLRISDLLSLRVCDVINVDGTYKNNITVYEQKTGKRRVSYLTDNNKKIIKEYIKSLTDSGIDTSIGNKNFYVSYLFRSTKGEVVTKESAHRIMKQMSRDLQLPYNVGTHTLRKTFAYWTIKEHSEQGDIMAALQKLLNHSDQRVTFTYAGIDDDVLEGIYEDLSDILTESLD